MVTGPRAEGFYVGNDKHTIRDVWEVKQRIEEYIASRPEIHQTRDWHIKTGDKEEQARQSRIRERRRLVWTGIKTNPKSMAISEESLVDQLQEIQSALKCGISRVEIWARDAIKEETSFLEQATKYQGQVETRVARRPQNCGV